MEYQHGYIYVLSNQLYDKALLKIGFTQRKPELRTKELFSGNTSVPQEFELEYACSVGDCRKAESHIHNILRSYRHKKNREFFFASIEVAKRLVLETCIKFNKIYNITEIDIIDNTKRKQHSLVKDQMLDENNSYIDINNLIFPKRKQNVLNSDQILRVGILANTLFQAIKDTELEFINSFEMDSNPEIEINLYENISKDYIKLTAYSLFKADQHSEVLKTLELLTLYTKKRVVEIYKPKYLSKDQVEYIVNESTLKIIPIGVHHPSEHIKNDNNK
jgi:hypothetical protein